MLEGGRFGGGWNPTIETRPEFGELKAGFGRIVRNGTKEELAQLLREYHQRDKSGRLLWLLTSGMAVEVATGKPREHHDLDLVIMHPDESDEWELLGTDNVEPGTYWAGMNFEPKYLEQTARTECFEQDGEVYGVEIVNPLIIMTQKLSDAFGTEPRGKDVADAVALFEMWRSDEGRTASDISVVNHAIESLPFSQRAVTTSRIEELVPLIAPR